MQCPNCSRTWPDDFNGCPICLIPFGPVVARGQTAKSAADRSLAVDRVAAPVATGDESIAAGGFPPGYRGV